MMIKILCFALCSLFLFSYNDFISDGNNSSYAHLKHIVNTSEDKIYLAIGEETGGDEDLVKVDASSANVIITKIRDITTIEVSKILSLKDANNDYTGEFVLSGGFGGHGRLEHFSYSSGAGYVLESDQTYDPLGNILDIVQKGFGGRLYFVTSKEDTLNDKLTITTNGDMYEVDKTIYERYLDISGVNLLHQSYLAEINQNDVSDIIREFSYNLDGAGDTNITVAKPDIFFTLGFDTDQGGDITIIGSNPIINTGSKFIALSVNASPINTAEPILISPVLIPPDFTLLQNQPTGTVVTIGSTAIYGPELNAQNLSQIIGPAFDEVVLPSNSPYKMVREGNISKLTQGYYNVTLGAPYSELIKWLDVNCSKKTPPQKYILPWVESDISALNGILTNQRGRNDYELCRTNDKFIYQNADDNQTIIKRQWEFIYDDETPIIWMQSIPNSKITGSPLMGRIETIRTDNTSIVMIAQDNASLGGINLFRIIDSTPGIITDRLKWHKTYRTGKDSDNNKSRAIINGPNLLKTIANDFVITGKSEDLTRTDRKIYDCMVIKFDKNGNELWTKSLGGFHDDNCYSVALEKGNTSPFYNDYVAVGNSGTRNPDDITDRTSYGVKFRDEGTLLHLADGWSLIANGTDRNITSQGKKEESNTLGVTHLGAYKSYFQFIKNQWLINQYPIEPLTGFWIYTIDGRHDIFLEGNLLEQTFNGSDLGWTLLGTGVRLINAKQKFNLNALWKFKDQKWIENPTQINPGEGFWAKKKR